ncbi:hypothetical protein GCM10023329_12460 [Streptomyces sanyensis]|uniref:Uncharacterized protein n=1 Tax=Streptomyces sanyensis TaxID=568869 RepID=A0ABP8ZW64_9ACTN
MTVQEHLPESPPPPAGTPGPHPAERGAPADPGTDPGPGDPPGPAFSPAAEFTTTAYLLTRITAQLGAQLSRVRPNGTRRPCPQHPAGPPLSP